VVERIDYIIAVQNGRDAEEHDIQVLRDNNRRFKRNGSIVGSPKDFVDFHDIVKQHVEQDSVWTAEIEKVENMAPGQV
jgi:hypothetical protein